MGASPPICSTVTGELTCGAKGAGLSSTGGDLPTPAAKPRFPAEKKSPATFATDKHTPQHNAALIAAMARKRKAGGGASRAPKAPKEEDSRMRINTFEDVADSEDEFHMNRDKILLDEGPAAKRMRKYQEEGLSSHAVSIGCED